MEVNTTNCRSCSEALDQGKSADTTTGTKLTQAHITSESWLNGLDPQRSHTERSLAYWRYLSYQRQRHTAATSVGSQDKSRNFHNSSCSPGTTESRRTPTPRLRLQRRSRKGSSKNHYTMNKKTTQLLDTTTNNRIAKTAFGSTL